MAATVKIDFRIGDPSVVARSLKGIVAEAKKAAAEGAKAGLAEERRAAQQSMALAKQAAAAKIKESQAAARASTAAIAAESRRQIAIEQAASRERIALAARESRERIAKAREEGVAKRAAAYQAERLNAASGKKPVGRDVVTGAAGGARRAGGAIATAAGVVTGGIGLATIVNAGRSQLELGKRNALLQNSSGRDLDFVRMSKDISNATGADASEVMGGFEKIAGKAGGEGIDQVKSKMLDLAKIAKGAGVNMTDLGDVVATLVNRGAKADDLAGIIAGLVQQGKDGAVEFKDLATMLDASSGALGRFKMGTTDRLLSAGGLSQVARTFGKKSAEESTNAVEDLARDLGGKADVIQALTGGTVKSKRRVGGKMVDVLGGGVEVGTDATRAQLRDVNTLLPEIIMGALKSGNAGKLMGEGGIFTGNSTAIVAPLIQAATMGIVKNGSGRYGIAGEGETAQLKGDAAIRALLAQFSAADVKPGDSMKAFEKVMATDGEKLSVAMAKLSNDMGDKLAPAIQRNIPAFTKFGEAFANATAWAIEHPAKAAASFVALNAALGGAQAALGRIGNAMLDSIFKTATATVNAGSVTVNGGVGGGGPGGPGAPGAAAMVGGALTAGATGFAVGAAVSDSIDKGLDRKKGDRASMFSEALNLSQKFGNGTATQADRDRAEALKAEIKAEQGKSAMSRIWEGTTAGYSGVAKGEITAANVASLLPVMALARGVYEGANATAEGNADSKMMAEALSALTSAKDKPMQLAAGQTINVVVTNAADLRQASNGQGPQAQVPLWLSRWT